jgi:hypothetical protein
MSDQQGIGLDEVPGLGRVRREALAEVGVVDLPGLLAMKVNELAAVRGIGIWQARKIREFLRQRGLLVEDGAPDDCEVIVIHAPETMEEATAVAEVVAVIEAQAEAEARVQAEVELISDALDTVQGMHLAADGAAGGSAPRDPGAQRIPVSIESPNGSSSASPSNTDEAPAGTDEAAPEPEAPAVHPAEEPGEVSVLDDLRARRERLPELALTLIEAIRQAAVSKQLTRQVTRLLITSGEFASGAPQSTEKLAEAVEALAQAEELLQRAVEKEAFTDKAQKELAERIRKRRKSLDRLLAEPEVEDR